jgi:hypothetical protein
MFLTYHLNMVSEINIFFVWWEKNYVFIYKYLKDVNYYSVETDTSLFNTNSTTVWRCKSAQDMQF